MALIKISNLTFSYPGQIDKIFNNVSFQIDTNWKLGLIGRNGRGKTTFLKLLLNQLEYQGEILSPAEFRYFPQFIEDENQEVIKLAYLLNPNLELWQLERELSLLDLSDEILHRPFSTLSKGEQTKYLLALLFTNNSSEFLLIDEPTNHLDEDARKILTKYLRAKKGFILISHDRMLLDNTIDHVLSINKANIELQKGNFSSWYYNKQLQDNFELSKNEKLKKEVKRLEFSAERSSIWAEDTEKGKYGNGPVNRGFIGHKAAKMMKRAKVTEKRKLTLVKEKAGLLKNIETIDDLKLTPLKHPLNNIVLLEDLSLFYNNRPVCNKVNFTIQNGDRVALKGKNGSGKSSILKLIIDEKITYTGSYKKVNNLIVSYLPQDTAFLKGGLTLFTEENHLEESLFKTILRKLAFSREDFEKDIKDFSAGQKKKVLIAKSLCEKAHLYLWDEPLNYIDLFSRIQLEKLFVDLDITILFVEHDATFSRNIATKVIEME